jgi:hypothetical protein
VTVFDSIARMQLEGTRKQTLPELRDEIRNLSWLWMEMMKSKVCEIIVSIYKKKVFLFFKKKTNK